ncbi:MAG: putative photosynthetic complex assembly protein PuhE [Pseudomonadota bacterium]
MSNALAPVLSALVLWWASTGALIWLVGRPRDSHPWIALGATGTMAAATVAMVALRPDTSIAAAYAGFIAGLALWAWHETMFLLGYISGPRRSPCPPGLKTWPRFIASTQTVLHHEIAIVMHGLLIAALSIGAENQIAAYTFALLWFMRVNAKLVVFLGAPNISDQFLPAHLTYLSTYFGKRRVTAFFPLFITVAIAAATVLVYAAATLPAGFAATGAWLIAALAVLAVIEHWALVLPIPDAALWAWIKPAQKQETAPASDGAHN